MSQSAVMFDAELQQEPFDALQDAAAEFSYQLTDAVIETTHLHWIIGHQDKVSTMIGRLKNRMRQRRGGKRIWTEGFSHRLLFNEGDVYQARSYLAKHAGLRLLAGQLVVLSPGGAGGFHS